MVMGGCGKGGEEDELGEIEGKDDEVVVGIIGEEVGKGGVSEGELACCEGGVSEVLGMEK